MGDASFSALVISHLKGALASAPRSGNSAGGGVGALMSCPLRFYRERTGQVRGESLAHGTCAR